MDVSVGTRLRVLRKDAGLTQAQLAALADTKQAAINRYETDRAAAPYRILVWYATYFNVSLDYIFGLCENPRGRYVSFSRNFGKEAGIYAGLQAAKGDYVATMDADLQDPPALLPQMLDTLLTGEYDCAATRRTTRKGEPPLRSWFARKFYQIINKMSDTEIVDGARDFRLMSRRMVDAVLEMSEYNRFSKGIFSWVGFKTKWFAYQNVERVAGQTKWNFWSLFKYSIEGIVGFSTQPLVMAALAGVIFCLAAFVGIIFVVVRALIFGDPTAGWPSMVCIMLLCSGVQLFCLGIVGEYLAKTYLEVKHRPIYITRETEQDRDERKPAQQK